MEVLFPVPVGHSLLRCRFLDWPHSEGKAPVFNEERYEVARYAMLKVKPRAWEWEKGGRERGGWGGRGRGKHVGTMQMFPLSSFRNLTASLV